MRRATVAVAAFSVLAAVSCGDDDAPDAAAAGAEVSGEVVVFAAASLTDAFEALAGELEDANPAVEVTFSFAASSSLREQILSGAPADVFAPANEATMQAVVDAGAVEGSSVVFARNVLTIAVPADNPGDVERLADLGRSDLLVGLCAPEVPCGGFARELLARAGVQASVDTEEPDVRSLLTKLSDGELDAGIVYVTDVRSAGRAVAAVEVSEAADVVAGYPIARLADGPNPRAAAAFVELVTSSAGREILADHGFVLP